MTFSRPFRRYRISALAMITLLVACGGGGGETPPANTPSDNGTATPPSVPKDKIIGTGQLQPATFVVGEKRKVSVSKTGTAITGQAYKVNDVLIIDNASQRGIFKVTTAKKNAAGTPVYTLESAGLTDAFKKLDITFNRTLTPADTGQKIETGDPELQVSWVKKPVQWAGGAYRNQFAVDSVMAGGGGNDPYLEVKLTNGNKLSTSDLGVTINGKTTFKLNPNIDFDFDLSKARYNLVAKTQPAVSSNYTVRSSYGGGQLKREFSKPFPAKPAIAWRGVIMAGTAPIPVWITWQSRLTGSLSGQTSGKLDMNVNYTMADTLGVQADNEKGARVLTKPGSGNTGSITMTGIEAEHSASANIPNLSIEYMLYGLAGSSFDTGLKGNIKGIYKVKSDSPKEQEGIQVSPSLHYITNAAAKLNLGKTFPDPSKHKLDKNLEITRTKLPPFNRFFPFTGEGAVVVNEDSSTVERDDVFRVAINGIDLGITKQTGSGQFRVKSLAPGDHKLTITTIEDENPPGTWEISLNEGITFSDGSTYDKGTLPLNQSKNFDIIVPKKQN